MLLPFDNSGPGNLAVVADGVSSLQIPTRIRRDQQVQIRYSPIRGPDDGMHIRVPHGVGRAHDQAVIIDGIGLNDRKIKKWI